MTVTAVRPLPMVLTEVETVHVERLSPTFVRIELGSPALAEFGVDGPLYDQRIKLLFPGESGVLPSFEHVHESWYATWQAMPAEQRGHLRTYTVRGVRGSGADTRVVVDVVLHLADEACGPGSSWAAAARPGDRLVLLGPKRGEAFGGIEFAPAAARSLLLVGDETAVPAVCSILGDLDPAARGAAFLEVPHPDDVQDVAGPPGMDVVWLPRGDGQHGEVAHGELQVAAVRKHLGLPPTVALVDEHQVAPNLWETPTYSSSGEDLPGSPEADRDLTNRDLPGLYAWIAGESRTVTTLRRCLVKELGVDRRQVAFMGYWRRGVAMGA